MSMNWKYISNENDGIIDIIYCSDVDLTIPIKYSWTILLKDGTEVDLFDNNIKFTDNIDKSAIKQAKENASYLI